MACFLVPAAEAVIATAVEKAIKPKNGQEEQVMEKAEESKIPFSRKLRWLTGMLWGGSILLAFEHVWHGEVVPWFPFLTAAENPADTAEMLHEMGTIGVGMAIIITLVWCGMLLVSKAVENKVMKAQKAKG
ncbi:MAG: hypothetical protein ACOYJU_08370 [Anaerovoracaceae bacterium]|jgi:hypothetical protein